MPAAHATAALTPCPRPVFLLKRVEAGALEGLTDANGWMQLMTSDQFLDDAPPYWSVTFSVDDTDVIAERAEKLGGRITVPPFDVPHASIAVVTDPQRAVFSVSNYNPLA
jgi:predicted enzyme related to lactoylglutathione lyase